MTDPTARFLATFLGAADLAGLQAVQDSRLGEGLADPGDDFDRHGGVRSGMQVWMGDDTVIWRLVDIRWLFEDARGAAGFHREQVQVNSEGAPPVVGAPLVGKACMVFGGANPTPFMPDMIMTAYSYVFLVGPILVKLFAAQSFSMPPSTLTPVHLAPLATRAQRRIDGAFPVPT